MVVRDISFTAIPRVLGIVSGLASTVILTHGLSQSEYGLFATWLAILTFAAKTSDLSISSFTRFFLPRQSADTYTQYIVYGLTVISTLGMVTGTLVGLLFLEQGLLVSIFVGVFAILALMLNRYFLGVLHGLKEFEPAAQAEMAQTILKMIAFAVVVVTLPTPIGALIGIITANLFSITISVYHLRAWLTSIIGDGLSSEFDSRKTLNEYKEFAPYEILNTVVKSLTSEAPIWILATILGVSLVAYWNVLRQFIRLVNRLVAPVNVVFYPKMSEQDASGRSLSEFVAKHIKFCLVAILPLVVGGTIIKRPLIRILFSAKYVGAADSLPIFLLTAFFLSLSSLRYFLSQGRNRTRFLISVVRGLVMVGGITVGAFVSGFHGATLGFLISSVITTVVTYGIIFREIERLSFTALRIPRILVALFGLAVLAIVFAELAQNPIGLFLGIMIPGAIYGLLVVRIGIVTTDEKRRIIDAAPNEGVEQLLDRVITSH